MLLIILTTDFLFKKPIFNPLFLGTGPNCKSKGNTEVLHRVVQGS